MGMHSRKRSVNAVGVLVGGLVAGAAVLGTGGGTIAGKPTEPPYLLPDIIEEVPDQLQIQNTQQGEYLRFSTTHINIGSGNLQIRGGGQVAPCVIDGQSYDQCTFATQELLDATGAVVATNPAGVAAFHPEHNHWHQNDVAEFAIRTSLDPGAGTIVAGTKVTFCLVDVKFVYDQGNAKKDSPRTYWECNGDLQGIASGWGDSYHQSTPGQELDVTGLPAGEYYLTHLADPDNHWLESNDENNFTWVKFRLSRKGANPEVTVLETSPCDPEIICGYGGNP